MRRTEHTNSSRDRDLERRVTLNVMMTPWVWALSPAWAMWVEPPPPPRAKPAPAPSETMQ